jgi:UDP-glucuronate 4-epimerase
MMSGGNVSTLVTGAAGFIGSHLCAALLQRGHVVVGVDAFTDFYDPQVKRSNIASLSLDPHFTLIEADLAATDLDTLLVGVDAIVHLAGEPGVSTSWGQSFDRYVRRNILTTQQLLEAACRQGVRRFVFASSSSVYGSGAGGLQARHEPRPTSPYGVTKLAAEKLVGAYEQSSDLQTVSLRYFSVYGPRQRPDMAAHRFIEAMLDDQPVEVFGDGRQVRDFTYVCDIVEATVSAIHADLPRAAVLDVASGQPVDVSTLVFQLGSLLRPDVEWKHREERRGDVARTEGRITAAQQHLGWRPTMDLRTGLEHQIEWHRQRRELVRARVRPQPVIMAAGQTAER